MGHPPPTTGTASNKKEPLQTANTFCRETEFFIPKFPFFFLSASLSLVLYYSLGSKNAGSLLLCVFSLSSEHSSPFLADLFLSPCPIFYFVHSDGPACVNLRQLGIFKPN